MSRRASTPAGSFRVSTSLEPDNSRTRRSWWSLWADVVSVKVLVWIASVGRDADLTPQAHIYFFDRYRRLADYHRARGHSAKVEEYEAKADEHYRAGGGDGPPYAAAMAMPRPRRLVRIDAVGRDRGDGPDEAA